MGNNAHFSGAFFPHFQIQYMLFLEKYAYLDLSGYESTSSSAKKSLLGEISPTKPPKKDEKQYSKCTFLIFEKI